MTHRPLAAVVAAVLVPLAALTFGLSRSAAVTPTSDSLKKSGESVIEALKSDDLAAIEARFDKRMRELFPHEKFAASWNRIRSQAGNLKHCDSPSSRPRDKYTILEYRCDFEQAPMSVRLAWGASGELSGLIFSAADDGPATSSAASPAASSAASSIALAPPSASSASSSAKPPAAPAGKPAPTVPAAAAPPSPAPPGSTAPAPASAASAATPANRFPEEQVTTGAPGWPLPGTVLLPLSGGRAPAVVFVHASGPNDRDETNGPNKPFRDLASGLAAKGIASLRYEKRTRVFVQRFKTELPNWTLDDEVVDDAVAALALMAARNDVGPLFVVGHALGAILAPRIAAAAVQKGVRVAGVVMLAAPFTSLADVIVYQYEFLSFLPVNAPSPQLLDEVRTRRENVRRLVEQGKPDAKPAPLLLDMPASAWLDAGRYDQAAALLEQSALPALLIFGGRDFQVPITEKRLWGARVGERPGTTLVEFPSVNHLMIEGKGTMSPAEYEKPGRVSQDVIDRIAGWVKSRS